MRKKCSFWIAVILMMLLVAMAAGTEYVDRVIFMLAAAAVGCVWMICESAVERAQTPITFAHEPEKPPEDTEP